jgi:predicted lipid carrier protein YhbT
MRSQQPVFVLPDLRPLVRQAVRLTPSQVSHKIAQLALNRLFAQALKAGELAFLNGRSVRISVSDINLDIVISGAANTLSVGAPGCTQDVTLRASSEALLAIITNQSDPDTLFFNRQLSLAGDTELGLHLKNYLDTCEPEQLLPGPIYRALALGYRAHPAHHAT